MRVAVIGAGPGGYVAAIRAAQLGAQVTVVEEKEVGGTCLNLGCIPTKTMKASVEALHLIRKAEEYGITVKGEIIPDLKKILERKDRVLSTQRRAIRSLFKARRIQFLEGKGELLGPDEVKIKKNDGTIETIKADSIIIATGSRPARIQTFPFDGVSVLSSDDIWSLTDIPESLIIIGAGVIGCEFACIFRELGTEVTLVELLPRVLSTEDEDISEIMEREFKKKKIKVLTSTKVESVSTSSSGVTLKLSGGRELVAQKVLVSIGRSFNSEGLGLDNSGVERGSRGEIRVNARMETSQKNIYAVGDVTGGILLAHVASRQGIVAATNACGGSMEMDYSAVPSAIFTSPEIASVGLREFQAKEDGIPVVTGTFEYRALGRAHAMGEITGLFKVIADSRTDRVLGVHIIGAHASEIIHEATLAIRAGLRVKDLSEMIHAHPTLSEGLMEASEDVHHKAIHKISTHHP